MNAPKSFPHRVLRRVSEGDTLSVTIATDGGPRTISRVVERVDDGRDIGEIVEDPHYVYLGGGSDAFRLHTFKTLNLGDPVYASRDVEGGLVGSTWRDYGRVEHVSVEHQGKRALADGGEK